MTTIRDISTVVNFLSARIEIRESTYARDRVIISAHKKKKKKLGLEWI